MDCIFFHPRDSHTKGSLVLIHPGLEGITEVETNPKGGLVSFKVTSLPLMTEFCVYVPSGYSTREQLARERFFKGLQNYMKNKIEGKEKKLLGDFNCTMDKMDGYGGNKTQKLYRCWYPLLIIITLFLLTDSPQKINLENVHGALITLFYVSPRECQDILLKLYHSRKYYNFKTEFTLFTKNTKKQQLFSK